MDERRKTRDEGRKGRRTSSTDSAPSIACRTLSFSSLFNNRPAFPLCGAPTSTPGSNVLLPTSEGADAPAAAAAVNCSCSGVGSPEDVRKREVAWSRSCREREGE